MDFLFIGLAAIGLAFQVIKYLQSIRRIHMDSIPYSSTSRILLQHVKHVLYIVRESYCFKRGQGESLMDLYHYECAKAQRAGSFVFQMITHCVVVLLNSEMSKVILKSRTSLAKSVMYKSFDKWLADGLITGNGQRWQKMRRLFGPVFHRHALDRHNCEIIVKAEQFSQELIDNEEVDVRKYTGKFSLDILLKTIIGVNLDHFEKASLNEYLEAVQTLTALITERTLKPHYWSRFIYNFTRSGRREARALTAVNQFIDTVIKYRQKQLDTNLTLNGGALLDILIMEHIRNPTNVTFQDIRIQANTFIFAGHDTSSAGLSLILYLLGSMPEIQERVFEEVLALCPEPCEILPDNCLPYLKYTEAVVKESLRIYPPVPLIARELGQCLDVGKGPLSAGTCVIVDIAAIHMDPVLFPKPYEFMPERFLKADAVPGFIPFSLGPRNCIGQRLALNELVLATATVIKNCTLQARGHRDQLIISTEVVTRVQTPLILSIKRRQQQKSR